VNDVAIIPLQHWPNPQGDVLLSYSERVCSLHYACWVAPGDPADFVCRLSFSGATLVRAFGREYIPYRVPEHTCRGYLLHIRDSDFATEHAAYRRRHYPHFPPDSTARSHYVFQGHDLYYEFFASSFTEAMIPQSAITDERLLELIHNA